MRVKGETKLTNKWKQAFSAKKFSITDMFALMKIKINPRCQKILRILKNLIKHLSTNLINENVTNNESFHFLLTEHESILKRSY